jgi:hypothetical protein
MLPLSDYSVGRLISVMGRVVHPGLRSVSGDCQADAIVRPARCGPAGGLRRQAGTADIRRLVTDMTEAKRPHLVVNPSGDRAFADAAEAALQESDSPAELQRVLRRGYARAVVRPRELEGETAVVWYIYRDGRWIAGRGEDEV